MRPPEGHTKTGGRLSGYDVRQYMEDFAERFLKGRIRFETEVLNIRRGDDHGQGWSIHVRGTKGAQVLNYPRIVLCTGVRFILALLAMGFPFWRRFFFFQGCSNPHLPKSLSPAAAKAANFSGPVLHSMHFASRMDDLLQCTAHASPDGPPAPVIVVGGGKSAQEWARPCVHPGYV